jgi:hypothetical protein
MKFNATIELNKVQVLELITKALEANGFSVSHQDIEFNVQEVELGDQRDSWKVHEFTGVRIKNIQIGE